MKNMRPPTALRPTRSCFGLIAGSSDAAIDLASPGTNDTRLSRIKRPTAIRRTPITSRFT